MSDTFSALTSKQLRRAATIRERIDGLEKQLAAILNVTPVAPPKGRRAGRPPRRKISKAARARISAAAKKRWAAAKAAGRNAL